MPVIYRWRGYRFFFFSNEGIPPEPMHIHVQKGESIAKFWMQPSIKVAEAYKMSPRELRELMTKAEEQRDLIERSWYERFGD
jgi:hypothetical protein